MPRRRTAPDERYEKKPSVSATPSEGSLVRPCTSSAVSPTIASRRDVTGRDNSNEDEKRRSPRRALWSTTAPAPSVGYSK